MFSNPTNNRICIPVKYHDDALERIEELPQGDMYDLRAAEDVHLKAGEDTLINLGISISLPEGYTAYLMPRSSTYKRYGIIQTNSVGVIDNTYCGTNDIIKMPVHAVRDTFIPKNDRICQLAIYQSPHKCTFLEVDTLDKTDRGGFGSTGKN